MNFKLSETGMLTATTKAFVEQTAEMKALLGEQHPYFSFEKAIAGKANFPAENRQRLHDQLHQQYSAIAKKEHVDVKVWNNIELLKASNTFTVCSGQQLHLFFGPAFVIYKILALVDYCEALKAEYPDKNFVPVYWPASEDHDFDEIKNTKLFNQTFTWDAMPGDACGRLKTDRVKEVIEAISSKVNLNEEQSKLLSEFEAIYSSSENLSEATIRVVNAFMGAYGVICVNGDNKVFKQEFTPVIEQDLVEQSNYTDFEEVSKTMLEKGFSTQLNVRPINCFYLHGGKRQRIVLEDNVYKCLDGSSIAEASAIKAHIAEFPERFSPNAMLRPLYQETILPNIAYLGGNAEITYWIQLHKVMANNKISHPTLVLRPSVWISPQKTMQWLEKRHISPLQVLTSKSDEELLEILTGNVLDLSAEIAAFNELRSKIQNLTAQNVSSELKPLVEAGKVYEKHLKNVDKAIIEAGIQKSGQEFEKLKDIKLNLFNINSIQERKVDSLEMLIKFRDVVFSVKNSTKLNNSQGHVICL